MHVRIPVLLLSLCFSALTILANSPGDVRPQFHFKVTSIIGQHADTCYATVRGGTDQGLFEGATGQWLKPATTSGFQAEGIAWVKNVYPTHAVIALIHDDFKQQAVKLEMLNQVRLAVNVPMRPYRGIFFDLIKQGVALNSLSGDPLLDAREILSLESVELENMILIDLVDESQAIGEEMPLHMDDPILESGLFADQKLFSVMEEATPRTVRSFLRFMTEHPEIYGIQAWNFGEVFATWLTQGTPHSDNDLEQVLTASLDDGSFQSKLRFFRPVIDASIIDKWNVAALELANESSFEDAFTLNKLATEAAYEIENAEQIGWSHYYSAAILSTQEQTEAENVQYGQAIKWFDIARNEPAKTLAQSRLGANFLEMGKFHAARKQLKQAIRTGQSALSTDNSEAVRSIVSRSLIFLGLNHESMDKPKRAIKAYEYALLHLDDADTAETQERRILIYKLLADANSSVGRSREATSWRKKGRELQESVAGN